MNKFTTMKIRKDLAIELKTHAIEQGITLQSYVECILKTHLDSSNRIEHNLEIAKKLIGEETEIFWTKEQLEEQKKEILSEFNFHDVLDFCDLLLERGKNPSITYNSIAEIRQEVIGVIDNFIETYLESGGEDLTIYFNNRWNVVMSYDWDGEIPLMELSFRYKVSSKVDACIFGTKWSRDKKRDHV